MTQFSPKTPKARLAKALWQVYNRPSHPTPFAYGGNLPWDDPAFSQRMLAYHLANDDAAASRVPAERMAQVDWMWQKLRCASGQHLLDVTCGPGLYAVDMAERGMRVTGVDFAPAAIDYANQLVRQRQLTEQIVFYQQDVRQLDVSADAFDAAILLYGQLAVMTTPEAREVLARCYGALKPGGRICIEMLDQTHVDKKNSTWWYTDDGGLWGDTPYLHLGERIWYAEEALSLERYQIIHLESGQIDEIQLCDQTYSAEQLIELLQSAGFSTVDVYPAWDGVPLYDADEWIVYIGQK